MSMIPSQSSGLEERTDDPDQAPAERGTLHPGDLPPEGMIVADEDKLKLGKGVAFVRSRLKRLPQGDDAWAADFQALPKPIVQSETHYLGMVVSKEGRSRLADLLVRGRPTVNDLATLLAHA